MMVRIVSTVKTLPRGMGTQTALTNAGGDRPARDTQEVQWRNTNSSGD
jgi:hypothetical protein